MKRREQYYLSVPCSSVIADGVVRGAIMGTIWGAVTDLHFFEDFSTPQQPRLTSSSVSIAATNSPTIISSSSSSSRIYLRAKAIGSSAGGFAIFLGVYSGGCCVGEKITGLPRDHWGPSFIGGFLAGALSSIRSQTSIGTFGIAIGIGTLAGMVKYLQFAT